MGACILLPTPLHDGRVAAQIIRGKLRSTDILLATTNYIEYSLMGLMRACSRGGVLRDFIILTEKCIRTILECTRTYTYIKRVLCSVHNARAPGNSGTVGGTNLKMKRQTKIASPRVCNLKTWGGLSVIKIIGFTISD